MSGCCYGDVITVNLSKTYAIDNNVVLVDDTCYVVIAIADIIYVGYEFKSPTNEFENCDECNIFNNECITPTPTNTPTNTVTPTNTITPTNTYTPSVTPSVTVTNSLTPSTTDALYNTPLPTNSPTPSQGLTYRTYTAVLLDRRGNHFYYNSQVSEFWPFNGFLTGYLVLPDILPIGTYFNTIWEVEGWYFPYYNFDCSDSNSKW